MLKIIFILLSFSLSTQAFEWHGHRGARGLYPEDTIGAMKEGLKYPITSLEMDVVIAKDNEVMVSHDPWIDHNFCLDPLGRNLETKKINLYQLTTEDIARYDCGSKFYSRFPRQQKLVEHKPMLKDLLSEIEEVLKQQNKTYIKYNIEIKSSAKQEKAGFQPDFMRFTDRAMEEINKIITPDRYIIQSFDMRVLKYLKSKYPQTKLVLLRGLPYLPHRLIKKLGFVPDYFSPDYRVLCKKDVEYFHRLGAKVLPFTVNDKKTFEKMKAMGVDGVLTDYPDLISNLSAP